MVFTREDIRVKFLSAESKPIKVNLGHKKRSHLPNRFVKNRCLVNRINYIKQRNYFISLLRKTKKEYYGNLNERDVADNEEFWKTVKPLLSF